MTAAVAVVVFPIVGVIRGNMTVLVTLLIDDHLHWNGMDTRARLNRMCVFSAQISAGALTIITVVPCAVKIAPFIFLQ